MNVSSSSNNANSGLPPTGAPQSKAQLQLQAQAQFMARRLKGNKLG